MKNQMGISANLVGVFSNQHKKDNKSSKSMVWKEGNR